VLPYPAATHIWLLAVLFLTLTPAPPPDPLSLPFADKLAHALAFLWLMWWFAQLTGRGRWLRVALALVALGVSIEFLQRWGGVRHFEVADMLADALGVGVGWWLAAGPLGRMLWHWDRFLARRFSDSRTEEKT